ncbi:hypothetical protein BDM02DRAFT_3188551 [Thelephora ganbajun]|uniref:Uncharacterized protein n=1 Tax=Thelephora ganbajun TaxID=370292 RepID=A0ACB6ZAE9_THEGA|nr:hypothetical protein BDM02DRAFT_3188551 [Thelephora ganbajun]
MHLNPSVTWDALPLPGDTREMDSGVQPPESRESPHNSLADSREDGLREVDPGACAPESTGRHAMMRFSAPRLKAKEIDAGAHAPVPQQRTISPLPSPSWERVQALVCCYEQSPMGVQT